MKKNLRHWAAAAVGAAAAFAFTSCVYDPYYAPAGGTAAVGYGYGYGYGGSHFNTSVFVSTGNPRWGYDPNCYSYYDYQRRCYYDPYLNGYYPVGYRPAVVVGCPHPYGWRPGSGYCPPPRYVSNVNITNYSNREINYRNTNYSWAKQVHQQSYNPGRVNGQRPDYNHNGKPPSYGGNNYYGGPNQGPRVASNGHVYGDYQSQTRNKNGYPYDSRSGSNSQYKKGQKPSDYNKYVNTKGPVQGKHDPRNSQIQNQQRQGAKPVNQPPQKGGNRQQDSRPPSKDEKGKPYYQGQG